MHKAMHQHGEKPLPKKLSHFVPQGGPGLTDRPRWDSSPFRVELDTGFREGNDNAAHQFLFAGATGVSRIPLWCGKSRKLRSRAKPIRQSGCIKVGDIAQTGFEIFSMGIIGYDGAAAGRLCRRDNPIIAFCPGFSWESPMSGIRL